MKIAKISSVHIEELKSELRNTISSLNFESANCNNENLQLTINNCRNKIADLLLLLDEIKHTRVCTGCLTIEGTIDKKYLACCPDNKYVELDFFIENSKFVNPKNNQ